MVPVWCLYGACMVPVCVVLSFSVIKLSIWKRKRHTMFDFVFKFAIKNRKTNTNCYTPFSQYKLEKQHKYTSNLFNVFTVSEHKTKSDCSANRFSFWDL